MEQSTQQKQPRIDDVDEDAIENNVMQPEQRITRRGINASSTQQIDRTSTTNKSRAQQLARALEALPSADQFMKAVHMRNDSSVNGEQRFVVPYLKELHHVIHELLPKPNKGLWEPGLGLDRELLGYFALFYQNEDISEGSDTDKESDTESLESHLSVHDKNHQSQSDRVTVAPQHVSSSNPQWKQIRSRL